MDLAMRSARGAVARNKFEKFATILDPEQSLVAVLACFAVSFRLGRDREEHPQHQVAVHKTGRMLAPDLIHGTKRRAHSLPPCIGMSRFCFQLRIFGME